MTDSDRNGSGKADERSDRGELDARRGAAYPPESASGVDDSGDTTRLRLPPSTDDADHDDLDVTAFRVPSAAPHELPEQVEGDTTRLRTRRDGDDEEITKFRGGEGPADDDTTLMRARGAKPAEMDDLDATEAPAFRPLGDEDATVLPRLAMPEGADEPTDHTWNDAADDDEEPTHRTGLLGRELDQDSTAGGGDLTRGEPPRDDEPTVEGRTATRFSGIARSGAGLAFGAGTVLKGRFTLVDKLGEGGMGGVFKAIDLVKQEARDRNPHVAVKVLNENFAEHPDALISLQRESSRTQKLSHPNIASVYDFDRDGLTAFMVMELMEGDPLDKVLKRNRNGLGRDNARSIIRDIASALAYAHTQGLIHSDFKPGNIFLTSSGAAKVFDFGIARAGSASGEDNRRGLVRTENLPDDGTDRTLFDAGQLGALTPAYAACEMFEGGVPAPQDDVYALGIVAYQCFTGRHPFERKKAPIAEAQSLAPQRPENLTRREWAALRHALAFRRKERTPDAQQFLDEFFGVAGSGIRNALLGASAVAAVVAGLYFGGLIGPAGMSIEVPREWVELDTRIEGARISVQEQLAVPAFSPIWEEFLQRDIRRWIESSSPVIEAAALAGLEEAENLRRRVFEQIGLPLRLETPRGAGDSFRLLAGPFAGEGARAQREAALDGLRGLGLEPVLEDDRAAIAAAQDRALAVYLREVERQMPPPELPRIPTIRDGEQFVADPERLEAARSRLARMRDAQEILDRAGERYPTRPAELAALADALRDTRVRWQDHIDQSIATASSRQAEEDRAELLAAQREQAELERRRAYEAMRDDQVYPVFAGRCHQPSEIRAALEDFSRLAAEDQQAALRYASNCASSRVTRWPEQVMESRDLILFVIEYPELAALEPPDPCANRAYIGNGRSAFCRDELASGEAGPPVVVVPGFGGNGIYGVGRYEVSVAEFNRFCAATDCATPARGALRMPAVQIPVQAARDYAAWLSEQTGHTYRLPTAAEWRHAAAANGSPLDGNRNCYSNVRGVVRGESLINVTQGSANAWGMINHVGNAQEWATDNGRLVAVGGKHTDALSDCTLDASVPHSGEADPRSGFRLLREIR